jgi:hypothetical protein
MKVEVRQFAFATLGFLLWLTVSHIAFAAITVVPIQINRPIQKGYQFDVKRRNDRNPQQYAFAVDITLKQISFLYQYNTSIGLIHFESGEVSVKVLRKVPCKTRSNHVLCHFTVPKQSLANVNLGFIFEVPVFSKINGTFIRMPSTDYRFFQLKDVLGQ